MKLRSRSVRGPLQVLPEPGAVNRSALAERVFAQLRSEILHARLRPGEAVSENGLAARLDVSRTPVREAVQRLVREGLVQVLPQRGSYVALLSIRRIRDALFVREAVETEIVRRFLAAPENPAGIAALQASVERQAQAVAAGNLEATLRADEDFHRSLLHSCRLDGVCAPGRSRCRSCSRASRRWPTTGLSSRACAGATFLRRCRQCRATWSATIA